MSKKKKTKLNHTDTQKQYSNNNRINSNKNTNEWEDIQFKKGIFLSQISQKNKVDNDYEYVFDEKDYINFDNLEKLNEEGIEDIVNEKNHNTNVITDIRESLPIFKYKNELLQAVSSNSIVIVVGETGSGKTTQIPQYLYEADYCWSKKKKEKLIIGCTQPRRIAATSIASRVAEEMQVTLGKEVGYSVRFDEKITLNKTLIKYMTDGVLLRELLNDHQLSDYSVIIIDEAHERTISTEILFSLLKDLTTYRNDFKLIILSATVNALKFSKFFNDAPILNIPGRKYPIDVYYMKNTEPDYLNSALITILQIHITQSIPGDILVFLTGQEEIEKFDYTLRSTILKLKNQIKPLIICSVYANMSNEFQYRIFEPTPLGTRKVILATNIAETSITIDSISYVVDPGYMKEKIYNPLNGMETLSVVLCSKASANQRAGRAGRVRPGKCFRLYSKKTFEDDFALIKTPEIFRINLNSLVLILLSLGINDLMNFDFMDKPKTESLVSALDLLYYLGAMNSKGHLTKTGRKMVELPIDVMFSKCLISSFDFGVSNEILTIVSMIGESNTLKIKSKKKDDDNIKKEMYFDENGDHFTYLKIWDQWVDSGYSERWCKENFINFKTMKTVKNIRNQLKLLGIRIGIKFDDSKKDDYNHLTVKMIKKSMISGFFTNLARLNSYCESYTRLKKKHPAYIHPSSSLHQVKPFPKLILYNELVMTTKEFMRCCMTVDIQLICDVASHYYSKDEINRLDFFKK